MISESEKYGKLTTLSALEEDALKDAPAKKRQLESCLQLDIHNLMRLGIVREGAHVTGSLQWRNLATGAIAASCRYWVDCRLTYAASIGLSYQVQEGDRMMVT